MENNLKIQAEIPQSKGLKVIGASLFKAGTYSLKTALEILGFGPCYHMKTLIDNPSNVVYWEKAERNQPVDFNEFLGEYNSGVDLPINYHVRELLEAYPEAKVVLVEREDLDAWHKSLLSTVYPPPGSDAPLSPEPADEWELAWQKYMMRFWKERTKEVFEKKETAIAEYKRHYDEIKRIVPPEKLLVMKIDEGWAPLCKFLNVPVPNEPYPHKNDTKSFIKNIEDRKLTRMMNPAPIHQ